MNSWLILLLLLFGNQNSRSNDGDFGCGCDSEGPQPYYRSGERGWDGERDGNFEREYGSGRNRDDDCDCERERDNDPYGCNNNEPRFDPRFDGRPFNNSECGCNNQ